MRPAFLWLARVALGLLVVISVCVCDQQMHVVPQILFASSTVKPTYTESSLLLVKSTKAPLDALQTQPIALQTTTGSTETPLSSSTTPGSTQTPTTSRQWTFASAQTPSELTQTSLSSLPASSVTLMTMAVTTQIPLASTYMAVTSTQTTPVTTQTSLTAKGTLFELLQMPGTSVYKGAFTASPATQGPPTSNDVPPLSSSTQSSRPPSTTPQPEPQPTMQYIQIPSTSQVQTKTELEVIENEHITVTFEPELLPTTPLTRQIPATLTSESTTPAVTTPFTELFTEPTLRYLPDVETTEITPTQLHTKPMTTQPMLKHPTYPQTLSTEVYLQPTSVPSTESYEQASLFVPNSLTTTPKVQLSSQDTLSATALLPHIETQTHTMKTVSPQLLTTPPLLEQWITLLQSTTPSQPYTQPITQSTTSRMPYSITSQYGESRTTQDLTQTPTSLHPTTQQFSQTPAISVTQTSILETTTSQHTETTTASSSQLAATQLEDYSPETSTESPSPQPIANLNTVHAEELLEKYGYLDCVPPGSENTRLHRLLLYRQGDPEAQTSHRYMPLDFRLFSLVNPRLPEERGQRYRNRIDHYIPFKLNDIGERTAVIRLKIEEPTLKSYWYSRRKGLQQLLTGRGRGARRAVVVENPARLKYLPICTSQQIQQAIDKFQSAYHVGVGGTLDPPTLELLSRPRCGNPDNLMDEAAHADTPSVWSPDIVGFLHRRRRSLVVPERGKIDEKAKGKPEGVTKEEVVGKPLGGTGNKYDPAKDNVPDQKKLQKVATSLREATRIKHPKVETHVEWEPHPQEAPLRRRRWVEDLEKRIHSGEEDARLAALTPHILGRSRRKRSAFTHLGQRFIEDIITWRLVTTGYSSQLAVSTQRAALALAFRMWSEVIPRIFLEDIYSNDINDVNINIGFGRRTHLGCVTEFDGLGGELSHALRDARDAQIHMDDDEHFTLDSDHGTNLLKVAVHEIGHVLGLGHVLRNYSIMYAVYEKVLPNQGLELGWEDRKLVQKIYGMCVGKFSTVFDFLRWKPDGSLIYNTFFFRGDHFWMYENKYNRTRFGDPLRIATEWPGIPDHIDAYAHIFTSTRDAHLFFKGDSYYLIDAETRTVRPGFPRRIAHDFHGPPTAKKAYPRAIPSNLDAVYFDIRDENLYFFKGRKVYGYDTKNGSEGCCLPGYPRLIHDEFLSIDPGSRKLPKKLDAVYYSYTDQILYFFKDRFFWELASFHPRDTQRTNHVVGPFFIHDKWYDICDTEISDYNAYYVATK